MTIAWTPACRRHMFLLPISLMASCAAPSRPHSTALGPPTPQPAQQCYVGPIEVRVLSPDGSPAVGACLGLFGGAWYSETGEDPPPWHGKSRTDPDGRYRLENWRECAWPTFIYAFDSERKLGGFCVVENLADLAKPQTVQLRPARWVTGEIVCPELAQRGERVDLVWAGLSPVTELRLRSRMLRYVQMGPAPVPRFRFLLPAGRYGVDLGCAGAEMRFNVLVDVSPGDSDVDLGRFDLALSPLVRLIGQPAPPLDAAEWSDGKPRTLAELRGRPVLLCFWSRYSRDDLKQVFEWYRKLHGSDTELLLIHPPEAGGVAVLRRFLTGPGAENYPDVELDLNKWPFPTAIDRPSDQTNPWGAKIGVTAAPYGTFAVPFFVLIDRDGNVAATSQWKEKDFAAAVEKLRHGPAPAGP